jgi:hypothetical protein
MTIPSIYLSRSPGRQSRQQNTYYVTILVEWQHGFWIESLKQTGLNLSALSKLSDAALSTLLYSANSDSSKDRKIQGLGPIWPPLAIQSAVRSRQGGVG